MRMSRSPQNGGFHRSTGGGPLVPARASAPVIASSPGCPAFAMVFLEPNVWPRVRGRDFFETACDCHETCRRLETQLRSLWIRNWRKFFVERGAYIACCAPHS